MSTDVDSKEMALDSEQQSKRDSRSTNSSHQKSERTFSDESDYSIPLDSDEGAESYLDVSQGVPVEAWGV